MNLENVLRNVIKVAAVALTAPATVAVAGAIYPDNPITRLIVQVAGLTLVEGALLLGWWLLDNNKQASPAQRNLYAAITGIAYIALLVIALQHNEGPAGLVFRGTLFVAIMFSVVDAGILANLRQERREDRDITRHRKVKSHFRRVAIEDARRDIDAEFLVKAAERERDTEEALETVKLDKRNRLRAVRMAHGSDSEYESYPVTSSSIRSAQRKRSGQQRMTRKQAKEKLLDVLVNDPHLSLRQLGQVVDRSPETVRRYLNQLEEAGKISKNGQGVEVIAR